MKCRLLLFKGLIIFPIVFVSAADLSGQQVLVKEKDLPVKMVTSTYILVPLPSNSTFYKSDFRWDERRAGYVVTLDPFQEGNKEGNILEVSFGFQSQTDKRLFGNLAEALQYRGWYLRSYVVTMTSPDHEADDSGRQPPLYVQTVYADWQKSNSSQIRFISDFLLNNQVFHLKLYTADEHGNLTAVPKPGGLIPVFIEYKKKKTFRGNGVVR